MRYFENSVKRAFNPYEEACETEFEAPMGGAGDVLEVGLEDGYLRLSKFSHALMFLNCTRDDIQSVFTPIFDQIYDLVNTQIREVEAKCGGKMKVFHI